MNHDEGKALADQPQAARYTRADALWLASQPIRELDPEAITLLASVARDLHQEGQR